MTENDGGANDDLDDDDLPVYLPPGGPESVPGFCDRLIAHLLSGPEESEFTFEGVEVEEAQGVWLLPLGGYDPDVDSAGAATRPADPTLPPGGYAEVAETSAEAVRRALHDAWGEPSVRTPRLVGTEREPEGLLDYMMIAVRVEEAEMWDRGELFCVVITSWDGEPRTSMLRQVLAVLPREFALGGFAAVVGDEITIHDLLMHGEDLTELRRRAWLLSTLFDEGEVRVRDAVVDASRFSLHSRKGLTTVWTFADDGRALVVFHDPASEFARTAADQLIADHLQSIDETDPDAGPESDADADELREAAEMILVARMLDGVPDDLRELIAAPAENARGEAAEHDLEFRLSSDGPLPVISGVAWYDGEHWRVPAGLLEIGSVNDFGMDDLGFAEAVRRPLRLGGEMTIDTFVAPNDDEQRETFARVFAACPYPEQPRPEAAVRLGYGLPIDVSHAELVSQIERVTEVWWDVEPEDSDPREEVFRIGGRNLRSIDGRILRSVIAVAEPWTTDILMEWVDGLGDAMEARWGAPREMKARDADGRERKTPVARVMRGVGIMSAPIWWVNGHAVVLIAGVPDPSYHEEPQAILVIGRADALLDVMHGTRTWDLRQRARVIENVGQLLSGVSHADEVSWSGPPLAGSDLVPRAARGRLRAGDHYWVWHFVHDGRGLLMSFPVDAPVSHASSESFVDHAGRFSGVPDDLLSLVVDSDSAGLFPVATREGTEADAADDASILAAAISVPAVSAVLWRDLYDWRASEELLRRVRPARSADPATAPDTADPLAVLNSASLGVPQLQQAFLAGYDFTPAVLADERYARHIFDRTPTPGEATWAFAQLGDVHQRALVGSMNQFLDVTPGMPNSRYVLDAALANPDARHRREIALLLLEGTVDASIQLSHLTPINVLFENPTLDADDLPVVIGLLRAGARPGAGLGGIGVARHPIVQLIDRALDESVVVPFVQALLDAGAPEGLVGAALPDGRSVIEYVAAADAPSAHRWEGVMALLRDATQREDASVDDVSA